MHHNYFRAKLLQALHDENIQRRSIRKKIPDHGPPFANAFHYVPIWIVPRMRFGLLFFGFSVAAGLWAVIKSNNN
jgi:hypothetical protein